MRRYSLGVVGPLLLPALVWAQGYRVDTGFLTIEPQHWSRWSFPQGTAVVDADGVGPAFVQPSGDAVAHAAILAAGSDPAGAAALLDGDAGTWWEPDIAGPEESWWVQIDLGRTVNATQITLDFAAEGQGDPFYQFSVLTSNGSPAFSGSKALAFSRVGRTDSPNTSQRRFTFSLGPLKPADPGFVGDPIRYVLIQMTASRGYRAEELSAAAFASLPRPEQGAVDHYRREASGTERLVDEDQYQALAEEAKGPIRRYRRERPRLAGVAVSTAGDNLALGILERGGRLEGFGSLGSEPLMADGDYTTSWATPSAYGEATQEPNRRLFIDLGAVFPLERIQVMYVVTQASGPFPDYVMNVSDGARAPDGTLSWTPVAAQGTSAINTSLRESYASGRANATGQEVSEYQAFPFPLSRVRYFQLDYQVQVYYGCAGVGCSATIREVQFYGRGFLPELVLNSEIIELGSRPRTLTTADWEADIPEGTQLRVRTRTGNQLDREVHYFTKAGAEVSEAQYRKLLSFQRGDSLVSFVPGSDWSPWSQFLPNSGDPVTSPSPRRYLMIQAGLFSDHPEKAVKLRRLRVRLEAPLASELVGELSPGRLEQTGEEQPLTLYLRPTLEPGDPSFDRLLVTAPGGTPLALQDLRIGAEEDLRQGTIGRPADGWSVVPTGPDSLWVILPRPVAAGELVALRFSARLYSASNVFAVAAGLGDGAAAVWQPAAAGEASSLGGGSSLNVLAPFAESIVRNARVFPNPFTPNQDGVNEVQTFEFAVFKVNGGKPLFLEVYNLAGRRLRRVEEPTANPVGVHRLRWDGKDQEDHLVPPGLYLCRFGLEVDDQSRTGTTLTRVVSVVY